MRSAQNSRCLTILASHFRVPRRVGALRNVSFLGALLRSPPITRSEKICLGSGRLFGGQFLKARESWYLADKAIESAVLGACNNSLARIFTSAHRKLSSTFRTKRFHPAGAACCSSYNLVGAARSLERAGLPSYFVRSSCPSGAFFAGKRKIRVGAS